MQQIEWLSKLRLTESRICIAMQTLIESSYQRKADGGYSADDTMNDFGWKRHLADVLSLDIRITTLCKAARQLHASTTA
jgi:hypothetical protein